MNWNNYKQQLGESERREVPRSFEMMWNTKLIAQCDSISLDVCVYIILTTERCTGSNFFFFNQDFCIDLWVHLRKWHSWTRYAYPASTHDFYTYLSLEAFSSSIGGSFVQAAVSDLACGYTSFPPYHTRDTVYPKRKMENDPLLHVWKNVGENKNNFINELRSVFCIHFVLHCYISLWNACHSKGKEKQTYP